MLDDEYLLQWPLMRERCLHKDQAAWSWFDAWVRPRLGATLRRALGRHVDADEVVQAVLVRLWKDDQKRFRRLKAHRSPLPFLTKMGIRAYRMGLRGEGRRPEQRRRGQPRRGQQRRFVAGHSAVVADQVVDCRLVPQVVDAAVEEFMKTLTARNRDVFVRVVLNLAAEEPERGPRGASGRGFQASFARKKGA